MKDYLHLFTPVTDGLPEKESEYIVMLDCGHVMVLFFLHKKWVTIKSSKSYDTIENVTHWLDLSKLTTKNRVKQHCIELIDSLKDYTLESCNILGHDERDASEFYNIFIEQNKSKL